MNWEIRPLAEADQREWLALWAGYAQFYHAAIPDTVTGQSWSRLLDPESRMIGLVGCSGRRLAGFANIVLHDATWSVEPSAYLEDLFVGPPFRGRGLGRALIEAVLDRARTQRWSSVYWHTQRDNRTARALYDRYSQADDFVRYRWRSE